MMTPDLSYLHNYCERMGDPTFWGEPLNAVSNLCFIIAAVMAARLARSQGGGQGASWALIAVLFAIGVGSGLFHTIPNGHTELMDVLPITAFINLYLIVALRRFLALPWLAVAGLWAAYTGLGVLAQMHLPPDTLNGTIMYIPTYLTLLLLAGAIWLRDKALGRVFGAVVAVWTVSLAFRTADLEICEHFPIGTHFLWHALNAWVLYRLLAVVIRTAK